MIKSCDLVIFFALLPSFFQSFPPNPITLAPAFHDTPLYFCWTFCLLFFRSRRSHLISPVKVAFPLLPPLLQDLHLQLLHKLLLLLIKPYLILQLKAQKSCQKSCVCVEAPDNHADSLKERRRHLASSCCYLT